MELPDPSKTSIFSLKNRPFAPKGSRIVFKASIIKCYCYVSFRVGLYIYIFIHVYIYIYIFTSYLYKKYRLGSFSAWEPNVEPIPPTKKTQPPEALKPPGACLQNAMKAGFDWWRRGLATRATETNELNSLQIP